MTEPLPCDRIAILQSFGATPAEVEALLAYNASGFNATDRGDRFSLPLPPETQIGWWQDCINTAKQTDLWTTLQQRLIPLQFPIQVGISQTETYRQAVLRGQTVAQVDDTGVNLQMPQQLQLVLYPSLAGTIPVLFTSHRPDFVTLVQALAQRNEPNPVPDSMGACMISGFKNWHRLAQVTSCGGSGRLFSGRSSGSDRFMVLSAIPYSNVIATEFGLKEDDWLALSLIVRLEHECTHYLTKRLFGTMQNRILDELIADFWGMTCALGTYRADWFLHFLGLEAFPQYRVGGRLQNYRGKPPLADGEFQILQRLVKAAAENLEAFIRQQRLHQIWAGLNSTDSIPGDNTIASLLSKLSQSSPIYPEPLVRLLLALTQFTLEELADPTHWVTLTSQWQSVKLDMTPVADEP
ncbi:MAG: hypothetical protein WCD18_02240 [Thermosynechococcaceae cyanobacterium]